MRHLVLVGAFAALSSAASGQGPLPWQVKHKVIMGPMLPAFVLYEGGHVYGSITQITNAVGEFWTMSSPAVQPPDTDSVLCDFSGINLFWKSELDLSGMVPRAALGGATLRNAAGQTIGSVSDGCGTMHAEFLTEELPPGAPPVVMIIWDHVCYQDCNCDGQYSVGDFVCFQARYVTQDPYADCDENGTFTIADFTCFQNRFVVGGCL